MGGATLGSPGQSHHHTSTSAIQTAPAGSQHSSRPRLEGLLPASPPPPPSRPENAHTMAWGDHPWVARPEPPPNLDICDSDRPRRLPALLETSPRGAAACVAAAAPLQAARSSHGSRFSARQPTFFFLGLSTKGRISGIHADPADSHFS